MVRIIDRRITNGKNVWVVTGKFTAPGLFVAETVHGDITDIKGLKEAIAQEATRGKYWL